VADAETDATDATDVAEFDEADLADKAADATETTEADQADVADKPGDADEAKADEANKAEADEADAEADEAVEAIVTKEIEANAIDEIVADDKAIVINKADDSYNEANEVLDNQLAELEKLDAANEAIVSNEAGEADAVDKSNEAILIDAANKAIVANKANESNEAILIDEANKANKASVVNKVGVTNKAIELPLDGGNVVIYFIVIYFSFGLLILYSLTKYSAIFAEVKGYFRITVPNNQPGPMSLFFLKSNNQLECLESGWSKSCSLRN
jgi:hypothetical protein